MKCLKVLRFIKSLLLTDLIDNHVHQATNSKSVQHLVQFGVELLVGNFEMRLHRVHSCLEEFDQEVNRQVLDSLFAFNKTRNRKQKSEESDFWDGCELELFARANYQSQSQSVQESESQRFSEKMKVARKEAGQTFDFLETHQSLNQKVNHHDLFVLESAF